MLANLCPGMCIDRVEHIDLEDLARQGFTTLLFDLDNTLVSWRNYRVRPEILQWLERAREMGFKMCLVSNCLLRFRVDRLAALIGLPAIPRAAKPRSRSFVRALDLTRSRPEQTVVIGDQMFTDVLGGNRMGLFTILVRPVDRTEFLALNLVLQRLAERWVLFRMRRSGMLRRDSSSPVPCYRRDGGRDGGREGDRAKSVENSPVRTP